ncbi:MAG: hypothetical protein KAH31_06900, partial [Candidatus Sabulitectum sp.]|nr:hypothetical protein [Candidatus Sabulitectum sp.]
RFNQSPGTVPMALTGFPELPVVTCFVAVPDGVDLDLSFSANCMEMIDCLPVYPAPYDSLVHEHGVTFIDEFFEKDSSAYLSSEWYPPVTAEISGEFRLRDQRVAIVNVYPVQYLASHGRLRVWSDIEVKVNFQGTDPVWNQAGLGYYDHIIGDRLIGYKPDVAPIPIGLPAGSVFRHEDTLDEPPFVPDYVIIVAPGLDGTFVDDFAEYRASLNSFDVLIVNIADIIEGYGTSDYYFISADIIRNYTEALWGWSSPGDRPTYLLLIGDHDDPGWFSYSYCLPAKENIPPGLEANDEWLVLFDEQRDVFSSLPDMIVGRLPATETETLQNMFNLIESYESEAELPYPENLANRRRITRLAGTVRDKDAFITEDTWDPSVGWTDSLRTWMGYDWDNYYCGDGEDTHNFRPPNPDGSSMTSADWVDACNTVFERGSQIAFYSDHGDFHLFSAGLNWNEINFGVPDSTFDNLDVIALNPDPDHWAPFVLILCCTAGTFNHTEPEHESINVYECLCYEDDFRPTYDFSSDCLAEKFIKHTDCGAIGVFAGSNSSSIYSYKYYGEGILTAVFERGITRTGDAILSARLQHLDIFMGPEGGIRAMAQFNLLGDPAVDIGDRMKFRDCCDLIISPADLEMNLYPTMSVDGEGLVNFHASVRNAGRQNADPFVVTMEVTDGNSVPDILTTQCSGLAAGDETIIEFEWNNTWFTPPGTLYLTASATDPGGLAPDSWMPNNSASNEVEVVDFYPNETGWPSSTVESIIVPPVLCDFDGAPGHDLEIVITTERQLNVFRSDSPGSPIWESGYYFMFNTPSGEVWPSIPVAGNVVGDGLSDIIVDGKDELMIFNITSNEPISSFAHSGEWFWTDNHTVALADFVDEADFETRDEIVLIRGRELQIFDVVNDDLVAIRTVQLPGIPADANTISSWPLLKDLNGDGNMDIVVSLHYNVFMQQDHSLCFVYDYTADEFVSERDWPGVQWRTVPAVGSLPQGQLISMPTDLATSAQNPALLLDPGDLTTSAECQSNPGLDSYHVPYCIMADWEPLTPGPDRIIANTENQCFVWDEDGDHVGIFPFVYEEYAGLNRPPFPALGELDDHDGFDYADVITATREGTVFGISSDGSELINLGFPYILPASVQGGFVIADIDNDGRVEVVFGTMDNYIHIWELGRCLPGYAPWSQCQHDAARTGVLEED